jgi:DNA gyrase/topoisomerase IV subunit A
VSGRSGLGLVEVAVLEALDAAGATPDRRHRSSARVLAVVEERIGLAPGYAYQVLTDLALPWKVPVPLVDGHGNFGTRDGDPPAGWRYTEARLSPAGQVALAAERGEIAPVPAGLITGNAYQWGTRPPFRPAAVIEAIRRVLARPKTTGEQITAIVGPPDFMTGCAVTGDLAGLAAGRPVDLHLHARVTITDDADLSAQIEGNVPGSWLTPRQPLRTVLVIDNFPPTTGPPDVARAIASRAREPRWAAEYPGLTRRARLPVKDIADLSSRRAGCLLACIPEPDADLEELRRQLADIEGVTVRIPAALPRPLAKMIRSWASPWPGEDLPASLTAFEDAIASGRRPEEG